MHEAGHAAHFANIKMPSPLFSQERAPTSVAYAELQSMFLDALVGDNQQANSVYFDNSHLELPVFVLLGAVTAPHFI